MKARTLLFIFLGLVAFAIILAVTMPASFIASQVNSKLPGKVAVDSAQGNIFKGEARVQVAPGVSPVVIERVQWNFKPQRLANGQIAFDTTASAGGFEAKMEIARDGSRWHVRDFEAHGDASSFASFFTILTAYRFTGPVTASAVSLDGDDREIYGDVRIEWRDATTGLSDVRPVGSYRADWHSEGSSGRLSVSTLGGPLRIAGSGATRMPSAVDFSGEARAEPQVGPALDPLLNAIGPPTAGGGRAIEIRLR